MSHEYPHGPALKDEIADAFDGFDFVDFNATRFGELMAEAIMPAQLAAEIGESFVIASLGFLIVPWAHENGRRGFTWSDNTKTVFQPIRTGWYSLKVQGVLRDGGIATSWVWAFFINGNEIRRATNVSDRTGTLTFDVFLRASDSCAIAAFNGAGVSQTLESETPQQAHLSVHEIRREDLFVCAPDGTVPPA